MNPKKPGPDELEDFFLEADEEPAPRTQRKELLSDEEADPTEEPKIEPEIIKNAVKKLMKNTVPGEHEKLDV